MPRHFIRKNVKCVFMLFRLQHGLPCFRKFSMDDIFKYGGKEIGGGGKGNTLKSSNEITPNIALGLGSELRKTHSVV